MIVKNVGYPVMLCSPRITHYDTRKGGKKKTNRSYRLSDALHLLEMKTGQDKTQGSSLYQYRVLEHSVMSKSEESERQSAVKIEDDDFHVHK